MRTHPIKCLIVRLCAAFLVGWPVDAPILAEEVKPHQPEDHDVARDALKRGDVLPLETVLALVRKAIPGEVAGVEIERTKSGWMYEIKVIAPDGAILEIEVNAKTGQLKQKRND